MLSNQVETVVWFHTAFLGDLVLATAALNCLRKERPEIQQVMITSPLGAKVLSGHPALDKVLVVDKRKSGLVSSALMLRKKLSKERSTKKAIVLQIHTSHRSSLITACLGIPVITYKQTGFSFLARETRFKVSVLHEAARVGLLLEAIGISREKICKSRPTLPEFPLKSTLQKKIASLPKPIFAIAPGSVWATKKWPAESYMKLAQRIVSSGASVLLLGSEAEEEDARLIEQGVSPSRSIVNLAGQTTLDDLTGIYSQVDYLIANDSSPIHFASAFNVPTIAIFGATVESMGFGPLATGSLVVSNDMSCRPCSDHGPKVCPLKHFECMKGLSVDLVFAATRSLRAQS